MKLTILGSGGAMPTPRPFCQCPACTKARELGEPFKRNSSSLFINDINTVIDCGEDIGDSLNRRNVKRVDNLFITHWHPDHTFGLRHIIEANYNFRTGKAEHAINLYIPKNVYETLKQKFPVIEYYHKIQKTAVLHLIEDGDKLQFGNTTIQSVGFQGKESDVYAYLIEEDNKTALYAPCDVISFANYKNYPNLNLLLVECGIFSTQTQEIRFDPLIKRIMEIKPQKTIFTHIEEIETNAWGEKHFEKMKKDYSNINFDYAHDGMEIIV